MAEVPISPMPDDSGAPALGTWPSRSSAGSAPGIAFHFPAMSRLPLIAVLMLASCTSGPVFTPADTTITAWAPQPSGSHREVTTFPVVPALRTDEVRSSVFRGEALAVAEAYRTHRWTGAQANVRHGPDACGIRVDTPDTGLSAALPGERGWWRPGRPARGLPYCWGGFDSLEQFDDKLARGLAGGDIYTVAKRAGLESAVSAETAGIDCSGLVSRCWRLPRAESTRSLPALCDPLPDLDALRAGDILNVRNHHVMLFIRWIEDGRWAEVYEVGATPAWRVHRHGVARELLKARNYRPLRYRGIRDDPADGSRPWLDAGR